MEFVTSVFAAVTTAATAAGSAATAATSALASSGVLTTLQVASTGIAALGTLGAAAARADALRGQAQDEKIQANQDFIAGEQQANEVRRKLLATVAEQAVSFASNGIDLSSSVVRDARSEASDLAERQIGTAGANAQIRAGARRLKAARLYEQADAAETGGIIGALGGTLDTAVKIGRRG